MIDAHAEETESELDSPGAAASVRPMEIARHPSFTAREKLELLEQMRTSESGPEASLYYDDDHLARIAEAIAVVKAEAATGPGFSEFEMEGQTDER
ncbi:hypothetical protein EMQ25_00720 [Arsenicitalea aurantiaca]|uniref:Uncharacterized protein n=1 Tax=Arsenicitalea aurantiaca TaxID=1783274 RepID=A0A433XKB5_9HYPH|nr:hypothetical protein [Arsenicitalea aurantiaca]RUT34521.1 hypothetical protein EMQ25_00720 [Arsenicitalea aurantiaca]